VCCFVLIELDDRDDDHDQGDADERVKVECEEPGDAAVVAWIAVGAS
jgi:hypothetical protein